MTATALLTELQEHGVTLHPKGDRLAFGPREKVSHDLREKIIRYKSELLALLQSCATLENLYRRYWTLSETDEPMATFVSLHREIDILERQVGEDAAWRILAVAVRTWHQETGTWPHCNLPGIPEAEQDTIPELGLDLEAFEREGRPLEIKTPWLADPLWFVPTQADTEPLVKAGVHRGRVWTAQELRDLLAIPGVTREQVKRVATAKAIFEGTVTA